jgi:putative DNA primase/helicase
MTKAKIKAVDIVSDTNQRLVPAILDHSEILSSILESLAPVNFREKAELAAGDQLAQKHLLVMCVEELLAKVKEKNFNLARKNDFLFAYNGAFWKVLDKEIIRDFLGHVAEKFGVNALDAKHYEFKEKLYKQFISAAHFEALEPDSETVLINLQNGTFKISKTTQSLRNFKAGDFLTYQLPFEYDDAATCPKFKAHLDRVVPEQELQDILGEYFGYIFTKHLKMEQALLLYGSGANGKSVLFDVINALLGRENISNFALSDLMQEHNRALIANKLLNYGSEINAGVTRDTFKQLVSVEPIQARLKYGNSFTMENYAKLAFNANELPKDFDHSTAYFRRLLLVPFRQTIPTSEQDKTLAQKIIKTELAGVFNWILAGLKRLLKDEKFTESKIVEDQLATYRKESDSVAMFLEERGFVLSATEWQLLKNLYADYRLFCQEDGSAALKKTNFKHRLEAHGFAVELYNSGNRVYVEIGG